MHKQMDKILFFTHELIFWVYKIIKYERETLKLNIYFLTKIRSSVLACVFTQNTHASKHSHYNLWKVLMIFEYMFSESCEY